MRAEVAAVGSFGLTDAGTAFVVDTGAGLVFQESVRLYTHLQAGTVPLSTMSEALYTQFYNRLVRRKGDPAAATFLFRHLPDTARL